MLQATAQPPWTSPWRAPHHCVWRKRGRHQNTHSITTPAVRRAATLGLVQTSREATQVARAPAALACHRPSPYMPKVMRLPLMSFCARGMAAQPARGVDGRACRAHRRARGARCAATPHPTSAPRQAALCSRTPTPLSSSRTPARSALLGPGRGATGKSSPAAGPGDTVVVMRASRRRAHRALLPRSGAVGRTLGRHVRRIGALCATQRTRGSLPHGCTDTSSSTGWWE